MQCYYAKKTQQSFLNWHYPNISSLFPLFQLLTFPIETPYIPAYTQPFCNKKIDKQTSRKRYTPPGVKTKA